MVAQKQEYGKIEDNNNEEIREHCSTTDFFSTISNRLSNFLKHSWIMDFLVEYTGFEPVASTMRMLRAPNCANTPRLDYYITENIKMEEFFDLYLQDFSGYNLIQPAVQLLNSRTMIMR